MYVSLPFFYTFRPEVQERVSGIRVSRLRAWVVVMSQAQLPVLNKQLKDKIKLY